MRLATCHPTQKHYGHGLCRACWGKQWRISKSRSKYLASKLRYRQKRRKMLSKKQQMYYRNNLEKISLSKGAWYLNKLCKRHGITIDFYNDLVKKQSGLCAICKSPPGLKRIKRLVIDHDHQTGKVRGLLCMHCNAALGKLGDTKEQLLKVLEYLEGEADASVL